MPRIIEIVLFLAPFAAFVVWRLYFRTFVVPLWLIAGLAVMVLTMLALLIWDHLQGVRDAERTYVPATMQNGRIVPGRAGPPP